MASPRFVTATQHRAAYAAMELRWRAAQRRVRMLATRADARGLLGWSEATRRRSLLILRSVVVDHPPKPEARSN